MNENHWSNIAEAGAVSGIRFLLAVYRRLGRLPFRVCLYPVILYYFLFRKSSREASLEYLQHMRAEGRLPSHRSLLFQSYRHFMNFGESMLDKLAVWQGDISLDALEFHNHEVFDNLARQGKGCVMVGSHLGNLEICRALAKRNTNVTFNVLMHTAHATRFNAMLTRANSKAHVNVIQVSDISPATAIILQQKIEAGEFLVVAGDRSPISGQSNASEVSFLGELCHLPQGPFILASILRCPVLTIFCLRRETEEKPFLICTSTILRIVFYCHAKNGRRRYSKPCSDGRIYWPITAKKRRCNGSTFTRSGTARVPTPTVRKALTNDHVR